MKLCRQRQDKFNDKQLTGNQNTSTADENTPRASAILKGSVNIKLTDIDRQMDVSIITATITDRGQMDHTSFFVLWLSKFTQHVHSNYRRRAFDTLF
jgi:hypothetical protein